MKAGHVLGWVVVSDGNPIANHDDRVIHLSRFCADRHASLLRENGHDDVTVKVCRMYDPETTGVGP